MDDSYNSYSRKQLDDLFLKMIAYYGGDPKRIQHNRQSSSRREDRRAHV